MNERYSSSEKEPQLQQGVAIVGMACRFPGSEDYNGFWGNLSNEQFSVGEIPAERWDWRAVYGSPAQDENKTDIKWGGFIRDIDKFDPLFFNISPKEADYMDPQHRLFLQSAWHAIEDAGYAPGFLAGKQIGVYAGVSKNDYAELMRENSETIISFLSTGTVHSILANRVSYLLDFRGKSEVVDTACSSFLVALNNAVCDIRAGLCEAAVVGGVNAILTPTMYISHGKSGMLSKRGKCQTFDAAADGYVRAEGIGVVFVKPLARALADEDRILGVIRGCAVQHGGRANSLTSPSVSAQAAVITAALADAAVDPASITYIETHGTGTPLGDPIEINALKAAYGPHAVAGEAAHCGLGTVKTNIGHLESASGAAGLIKVLMSFMHQRIPALLHFKELNPYIELEDSPFYIAHESQTWQPRTHGHGDKPLRAGLSSFGMGGVNAHMILEAPPQRPASEVVRGHDFLILLSAKKGGLQAQVQQLAAHLADTKPAPLIQDIAFTLMFGRDDFEERLALKAQSIAELKDLLASFDKSQGSDRVWRGLVRKVKGDARVFKWLDNADEQAKMWVEGQAVSWDMASFPGKRIPLPAYPFRKRRCWFKTQPQQPKIANPHKPQPSHPRVRSPLREIIPASAEMVVGHRVHGEKMLPAAGYLLWLLKQVEPGRNAGSLRDVYWQSALTFDGSRELHAVFSGEGDNSFQIDTTTTHCRGEFASPNQMGGVDAAALLADRGAEITAAELYPLFKAHGLDYGPAFQVTQSFYWRENEAVSIIDTSAGLDVGILDGMFQAAAALSIKNGSAAHQQQVPYHMESFSWNGNLERLKYVFVKQLASGKSRSICRFELTGCDVDGEVLVRFTNFSKRVLKSKLVQPSEMLYYSSEWRPQALESAGPVSGLVLVNGGDLVDVFKHHPLWRLELGDGFAQSAPDRFTAAPQGDDFFDVFTAITQQKPFSHVVIKANRPGPDDLCLLLVLVQALMRAKVRRVKLMYLAECWDESKRPLILAAAGLARTLKFENAGLHLDVAISDRSLAEDAQHLNRELSAEADLHEVAYVSGQRRVRVMKAVAPHSGRQELLLKQGGVYVIAGGAGGLGRIFSKHLARTCGAKLILLGRRPADTSIRELQDQIDDLGGSADYVSVDLADRDQILQALAGVRERWGSIQGVIQAAGVIEDSFILRSSLPSFQRILTPKLSGTLHLDEATADDDLDFFVMFSSVAALMPNQGQVAYSAGNSFMDHYAGYRRQLVGAGSRSGLSLAINWPLWAEGGMRVTQEEQKHLLDEFGMKPLETAKGIALLAGALAMAQHNPLDHLAGLEGDAVKIDKSFKIAGPVDWTTEQLSDLLLKDLKIIVAQTLKVPLGELEAGDTFTSLEVDSLGFLQITGDLNRILDGTVKPTLFFECQTLAQVAARLVADYADHVRGYYLKTGAQAAHYSSMGLLDVAASDRERGKYQRTYTNREFYMVDHVVEGQFNVPGACYMEMARQAGVLDQPGRVVGKLTKNYWAKQLSSKGPAFTAHIQLTRGETATAYEIYSLGEDQQKTVHATGDIIYESAAALGSIDLTAIRARCDLARNRDEIYAQIHAEGLQVGPTFMPIQTLVMNENEALAEMRIPMEIADTRADYLLHPSILTGVFQTALINNRIDGDDAREFIPIAIESLAVKACIPQQCFVYSQVLPQTKTNPNLKKFNISVCNAAGEVVAGLEDFVIKARNVRMERTQRKAAVPAGGLLQQVQSLLAEMMAPVIGIGVDEIDPEEPFESYGINSIMITELNKVVEDTFGGGHSKTLFFENINVQELAEYFMEEHQAQMLQMLEPQLEAEPVPAPASPTARVTPAPNQQPAQRRYQQERDDIAIVGLAGRYPKANTSDELWDNLQAGMDCIEEIPVDRFDLSEFYDPDRENGGIYSKWGGFIDDVDKFDPLFFNISPREAELMDPQERLLLQTAWETVENAGYTRKELGSKVGVFVGALWQPYTALGVEATRSGQPMGPSGLLYNTANRISYFFNFQGPSMAVDTACSASLTALHLACHSIRRNECQAALAGGVNLSLDASKYLFLCGNNFLSTEGKCRSFGAGGDGYVPGEGVGLVMLKSLTRAVAGGDHIYGVIRATALNHGGKTNGYTVPKPQAQAGVIAEALAEAGLEPGDIGYIEAHGTGTALGDPVEITGLTKAFAGHGNRGQFCAIGSIKSNIGHLEANAAMAGLTKILLQFKHRQLVPSIHSGSINPNIDFSRTPFYLQRENAPWESKGTRRAALSSFGAGGSNGHLIVEEFVAESAKNQPTEPALVVFSAKCAARLIQMAKNLLAHLQRLPASEATAAYLHNAAYTLQVGREAMAHRVAFVSADLDGLAKQLGAFIQGETPTDTYASNPAATKSGMFGDADFAEAVTAWMAKGKLKLLGQAWVQGADLDWRLYGAEDRPKRVPLPGHPFLKESYWLPMQSEPAKPEPQAGLYCFTPNWSEEALADTGKIEQDADGLIFINTSQQPAMVQALKDRFPACKVLNIKKRPSLERNPGPMYLQIFEALRQTIGASKGSQKGIVLLTHDKLLPYYGGFAAMLKSLIAEAVIDRARFLILPESAPESACLRHIEVELTANPEPFAQVRHTDLNGSRWVNRYRSVSLPTAAYKYRAGGVYWITGGMGRMGLLIAEHLASVRDVSLVLSGRRSEQDPAIVTELERLRAKHVDVTYLQGDIANAADVDEMVAKLKAANPPNGIFHAAGLVRDGLFLDKRTVDAGAVLGPKIAGLLNLDRATQTMPLDFLVCFSSVTAALGNRGQADYALANGFMDAFARHRQNLVDRGQRSGQTLAVNWPLWREGGMRVSDAVVDYFNTQWGVQPLPTAIGLSCLDACLNSGLTQVLPLYGDQQRIEANFQPQKPAAAPKPKPEAAGGSVEDTLKGLIGQILKVDTVVLDPHTEINDYGFDSISLASFAQAVGKTFARDVPSSVFFEHDTIARIAAWLGPQAQPQPQAPVQEPSEEPSPTPVLAASPVEVESESQRPVAIIGLDCRFPGADNTAAFWDRIIHKKIAISDLPKDAFRFKDAGVADIEQYGGGFLADIDRFDAAFFSIDEQEARLMDPQQRLLMQSAWKVVEDAGYRMAQLSKGQTGLFIGVGSSDYLQLMCAGESAFNSHTQVGVSQSMLANRVSYQLNLKGPSEIVDTACSSSIVAAHRAIRSLHEGECDTAIVGGVSLLLSARGYLGLKHLGFLSPSRKSHSFDARADGYVRGEGVGTVLLKPLAQAEQDCDHIYAVIKGSGVYHGGNSTLSLIAPSKKGQIGAMVRAYHRAQIKPGALQYVEAHGTATSFGDPAEISALKQAFSQMEQGHVNGHRTGVGALKPNIGHLEAASGIASLIKLTLALKMKTKPPLTGFSSLNPGISLENSPFYIVRETEDWTVDNAPRRAGLNAYGFGGVNAHLVLEEYVPRARQARDAYEIILLSAVDPQGLAENVKALATHLKQCPEPPALRDVSFTLARGRTPQSVRLALVEKDMDALIRRLQHFSDHPNCLHRELEAEISGDKCGHSAVSPEAGADHQRALQLAGRWTGGETVDWDAWFDGEKPHRVALPTHRFDGKSYWYNQ